MLKKIFILMPLMAFIYADFDIYILPTGDSHSRSFNTSVFFSCEVENSDETESVTVKWVGPDNVDISERTPNSALNERKYVENDNGHVRKLYIKHIELGDAGNYTCEATSAGIKKNKSFKFIVYKEITFVSAMSPQHPPIHTDALIICKVDGLPKPEVSWRYKDKKLDPERYIKLEEGLLIKNITMEDDGIYQCSANVENEGRFDFKAIQVEVHVPPTMTGSPGMTEGVEDEEATISCRGEGYPNPEFRFYKNDNLVIGDERIIINTLSGDLTFKPLKEEDSGKYLCVAYNDVGEVNSTGTLSVLVRPQIVEFSNKSQNEGQPVSMECKARGNPDPKFEFTKDGKAEPFKLGDNSEEDDRISVISNGDRVMRLTIKRVIPSDAGNYRCTASNFVGTGEDTAYLNVTYKPRFSDDQPKEFYIWAQKTRNISCEADAHPPASFQWMRDGDPVVENSTYKIFESEGKSLLEITVRNVDQFWMYGMLTCQADNGYGQVDIDIDLVRATIPDIPKAVEVQKYLPNGFILSVVPPEKDGGEALIGYQVEYYEMNSSEFEATLHNKTADEDDDEDDDDDDDHPAYKYTEAVVEQLDQHRLKIEHLRPSTKYILKVKARNEVGLGDSFSLDARTNDVRKPYPIKIKPKNYGGAHHFTFSWDKPETGGAPIEEYEFKYRQKTMSNGHETFSDWMTLFRKDNTEQPFESFDLNNLEANSTFELQVRAKNKIDWSEYSEVMEFQTIEKMEPESSLQVRTGMSPLAIVGVVLFLIFIIINIIDLSCYACCRRGIIYSLVKKSRDRNRTGEKEKVMEEGEKDLLKAQDDDDIKKPPIIEETIEHELDDMKKDIIT